MSHRSRDPAERELQGPNAACPFGYQLALLDRNRNFSCTQAFRFIKFLLMLGDRWHLRLTKDSCGLLELVEQSLELKTKMDGRL